MCVWVCVREIVCVYVCVQEREKERERDGVCQRERSSYISAGFRALYSCF